jgi:alanyl-tRNA synthetase
MKSRDIAKKFLKYFEDNNHKLVSSYSLMPSDTTVLFTTAGMQQFIPYLSGEINPPYKRACSNQKCLRTSDIKEVGDESHLTFFEMLGNWSFGDYFKKEAIDYALDFLEKELKLNREKLAITIFKGEKGILKDSEAEKLWLDAGISKDKIFEYGIKDNFWGPVGDSGPCGPCSEIYYDVKGKSCGPNCGPNCKCGRYLEIWNLVFMQYYKIQKGKYKLLPQKSIDTGMGLERITMVLQNKKSVFEIDSFQDIIEKIEDLSGKSYKNNKKSFRIVLDHLKSAVFLISDGVLPAKEDRGYVLRRLLRSSIRHSSKLELGKDGIKEIVKKIILVYEKDYPEIKEKKKEILKIIEEEKTKFEKTLTHGLKIFEELISENKLSNKEVFKLYDTFGFPFELTKELAKEKGLELDEKEFNKQFEKHKEISKKGMVKKFGGHGLILDTGELKAATQEELVNVTRLHTTTHLLHQALRKVLGKHVQQMGSDITAERLRFDFSHTKKMNSEELERVEGEINNVIKQNLPVIYKETTYEAAIKEKALAFFKGKYPEKVKIYYVGNYSKEVCGGPHVKTTGELGKFKILKERSSSAGIRRIKAILE